MVHESHLVIHPIPRHDDVAIRCCLVRSQPSEAYYALCESSRSDATLALRPSLGLVSLCLHILYFSFPTHHPLINHVEGNQLRLLHQAAPIDTYRPLVNTYRHITVPIGRYLQAHHCACRIRNTYVPGSLELYSLFG